jgi:hypothetical protein
MVKMRNESTTYRCEWERNYEDVCIYIYIYICMYTHMYENHDSLGCVCSCVCCSSVFNWLVNLSVFGFKIVFRIFYSVVGIATGYRLDDRGVVFRVSVGSRNFSSPRRPDRLWGPPSVVSNWCGGVKRQGCGARSRKCVSIHPLPPYALMA